MRCVLSPPLALSPSLMICRSVAGSKHVDLMKPSGKSVMWAKLEPASSSLVSEFIRSLRPGAGTDLSSASDTMDGLEPDAKRRKILKPAPSDLLYLFDWSLPLNCPELAAELTLPKALSNNWLAQLPEGTQYHNSWPSLFAAPDGLASGLHIDAFCSSFWMAVFEGTKRYLRMSALIFHAV